MKKIINNLLILLIINFLFSCKEAPSDAPVIISGMSGIVKSRTTGALLKDAIISTSPSTKNVATDGNGYYEIKEISPAPYTVSATKSGYNPTSINLTVEEGKIAKGDIQMLEEGPELNVTPLIIDFGATQTSAPIILTNVGVGTINFNIAKNASWLTLSENSGSITTNPKSITLTVDRSSVGYGTFTDVVQVTSNGGNKSVNISITKRDPNAPYLEVNPTQLSFGTSISSLNLNITNSGVNNLNWSITKDQSWITVNPTSGTNAGTVAVTVNRTGLPNGQNFNGNVTITSNGGNKIIPVTMSTGVPYSGTWSIMTSNLPGINTSRNSSMFCLSSTNIWVVGDKIWNWNGAQWTEYTKPYGVGTLSAVSFSSSNNGWAVCDNLSGGGVGVIKFNGASWSRITNGPYKGYSVSTLSDNHLFIFYEDYVYESFNNGDTWQNQSLINLVGSNSIFESAFISNSNYCYAIYSGFSSFGVIKYDGLGWSKIYENNGYFSPNCSITATDINNLWITVYHTPNGNTTNSYIFKNSGNSFVLNYSLENEWFNSISALSNNNVWVGGGKIYNYNGTSWIAKTSNISGSIVCIKMISESEGYAVTGNGAILKYN